MVGSEVSLPSKQMLFSEFIRQSLFVISETEKISIKSAWDNLTENVMLRIGEDGCSDECQMAIKICDEITGGLPFRPDILIFPEQNVMDVKPDEVDKSFDEALKNTVESLSDVLPNFG